MFSVEKNQEKNVLHQITEKGTVQKTSTIILSTTFLSMHKHIRPHLAFN